MSEFSITSPDFKEGEEIPKKFGYKFENKEPELNFDNIPKDTEILALIMDDPDAMEAVGKVWVHWLVFGSIDLSSKFLNTNLRREGKSDFGEIGYGGPAPPNGRHTYIFKAYALDAILDLKEGYSKQDLEKAMIGHILAEAKLTGTFTP
jgi:Raf kinase inhibitor-like YbhB/YbcL family protein